MNPLLEWGLANSDPEKLKSMNPGGRTAEESAKLLRENRDFMEELLKTDVQRLKDHLNTLDDSNLSEDDKIAELDEMEMLVESIDNANALATIKGIPRIAKLFEDPSEEVRMNAIWVLGTCAQNNTRFTEQLLKDGAFEPMVALLDTAKSSTLLSRLVYAISGCVRASPAAFAAAINANTFPKLLALLSNPSSDLALKRKLVFLLGGVVFEHHAAPNFVEYLLQLRMLETLVASLVDKDLDLTEKVFEVLDAAFSACPLAILHIRQSHLLKDLQTWTETADVPTDSKATIAKTLSQVGITFN